PGTLLAESAETAGIGPRFTFHQGAQRRLPSGKARRRHHHARGSGSGGRPNSPPSPVGPKRIGRPAPPQAREYLQAKRRADTQAPRQGPRVRSSCKEIVSPRLAAARGAARHEPSQSPRRPAGGG